MLSSLISLLKFSFQFPRSVPRFLPAVSRMIPRRYSVARISCGFQGVHEKKLAQKNFEEQGSRNPIAPVTTVRAGVRGLCNDEPIVGGFTMIQLWKEAKIVR